MNPCENCMYGSENLYPNGDIRDYTCDLDDDPKNHPGATCCEGDDDGVF